MSEDFVTRLALEIRGHPFLSPTDRELSEVIARRAARFVLAEMVEPSEAMQVAGHKVRTQHLYDLLPSGTDEIWTAMLRAFAAEAGIDMEENDAPR